MTPTGYLFVNVTIAFLKASPGPVSAHTVDLVRTAPHFNGQFMNKLCSSYQCCMLIFFLILQQRTPSLQDTLNTNIFGIKNVRCFNSVEFDR